MDILLQSWGGAFYLANKVLFALSEDKLADPKRKLKLFAWSAYLIGVPAWVIILVQKHNWIAAAVEAGAIPAMILGLYNTYTNRESTTKYATQNRNEVFNYFVKICTYASLGLGLSYSVFEHKGLVSLTQLLEMGVMLGFLFGSYLMAQSNSKGWLFFMLMNVSMASLMMLQGKYILMVQQCLSLCFVVYGYKKSLNYSSKNLPN